MELAHLKKIFNGFNAGICVLDEQLKVYYWNHWLSHHTGINSEDIVGKLLHHYVDGVNKKVLQRKIKTCLMLKSPTFYPESLKNYLFKTPLHGGTEKNNYMKQSISIMPYADTSKVIIAITDKSVEFDFAQTLEKNIKQIDTLNKTLSDDAKIIDSFVSKLKINKNNKILKVSKCLSQTLSIAKNKLEGTNFDAIFTPLEEYLKKDNFPETLLEIARNDSIVVHESIEKKIYLKVAKHVESGKDEELYLFQDISDYVNLQLQQDTLLRQSRNAAMGEMISMIAHQWRQPLTVLGTILVNMNLKLGLKTLDMKHVEMNIEKMEGVVTHLSQTISDFRNFFIPSKSFEQVSVQVLFDKVLEFSSGFIQEQGIVLSTKGELQIEIKLYMNEFIQVLMTMIQNSVDAFKENEVENPALELAFFEATNSYTFTIRDNAGGIDKENIQRVFDPYFSTKAKNGTGIGLYMAKKIIYENMKGSLAVESKNNETIFSIQIPKQLN